MNSLTKLVMASAVVVAFAAPALAYDYNYNSEGFPLQTRNENLVQQPAAGSWDAGTDAYAMEPSTQRSMDRGVWIDNSAGAERGAATINGGR